MTNSFYLAFENKFRGSRNLIKNRLRKYIPFIEKMKTYVTEEADEYIKNQQDRDRGHYHSTVFSVAEYNSLIKAKAFDVAR